VVDDTANESAETQRLLEEVRRGEPTAFDRLFVRHRAQLHRAIDIRLNDVSRQRFDASDVVQETQLEAARRMPEYLERQTMPFHVWLRKTAQDRLLNMQRHHFKAAKRAVAREVSLPQRSSVQLARQLLGAGATPSAQASHREMARQVRQAVTQLAELDREIVLMMDIEGLSSEQVGYILDVSPVTVRRHHTAALLQLHKILRERGVTESQV
jgi:RNA polymerase sigma-70 factor (ECF subfamily)